MKRKNKTGLLMLAILVLILSGAVGYTYYKNRTTQLNINEAGISLTLPASLKDLYYNSSGPTPNSYYFSTKKITALDSQCSAQAISLGAMYVYTSKAAADNYISATTSSGTDKVTNKTTTKDLDGKFYVFDGGSNQYCSSKQEVKNLQKKQSEAFITAGQNLHKGK